MTSKQRMALVQDRYNKLSQSQKNIKSTGVLRKLRRQLRNLDK